MAQPSELNNILANMAKQQRDQAKNLESLAQALAKPSSAPAKRPLDSETPSISLKLFKRADCPAQAKNKSPELATGSSSRPQVGALPKGHSKGKQYAGPSHMPPPASFNEDLDSDSDGSDNFDTMSNLENIVSGSNSSATDNPAPIESDAAAVQDDLSFEIIGEDDNVNWVPHPKVLSWYQKVANKSLSDSILKEINDNYIPPEDISSSFSPAKFPAQIWQSIKESKFDYSKQKFLYNLQGHTYNAIKPLLSILPKINDDEIKSEITTAIQLLCVSNLEMNRFRRLLSAPYLKPELKSSFLKLPVTQGSLFGEDFDKSSDKVLKEYSSISKVLKPKVSKYGKPNYPQRNQPFRGSRGRGYSRGYRGRGRASQRGRGKPYNYSGNFYRSANPTPAQPTTPVTPPAQSSN